MAKYYINKNQQFNGDHEVHREDCLYIHNPDNYFYLGDFLSSHSAVARAKILFPKWYINGCAFCCPESHTR